jgi:hypothetical protein
METYTTIALFGEAEKGEYRIPCFCQSVPQLLDKLGHPPPDSFGIFYAIQALLYHHNLLFFRVREEGFSYQDYLLGLHLLQKEHITAKLAAICLPGVGDAEIIEAIAPVCALYHSILIVNEADLYDYLTEAQTL